MARTLRIEKENGVYHIINRDHFHLVVRTPKGNLIHGMQWLQATFANRYHRFRNAIKRDHVVIFAI